MNILVTGGAGYVGTNLIPELIKDGHYVKCLDRLFFGTNFLSSNEFEGKFEIIRDDAFVFALIPLNLYSVGQVSSINLQLFFSLLFI